MIPAFCRYRHCLRGTSRANPLMVLRDLIINDLRAGFRIRAFRLMTTYGQMTLFARTINRWGAGPMK